MAEENKSLRKGIEIGGVKSTSIGDIRATISKGTTDYNATQQGPVPSSKDTTLNLGIDNEKGSINFSASKNKQGNYKGKSLNLSVIKRFSSGGMLQKGFPKLTTKGWK